MEISSRVEKLREKITNALPEICWERAFWMTESYKETEGQPEIIRRAKSMEKILANMSIGIDEGELIVGKATSKVRGGPLLPEVQCDWYLKELDTISTREWDRFTTLTKETKEKIVEFSNYWRGKSLSDRWTAMCPESALKLNNVINAAAGYCNISLNMGHFGIAGNVLDRGLNGIKATIDREFAKLDIAKIEDFEKSLLLKAMNTTLDAVIDFAHRYSALAKEMAQKEKDAKRKAELEKISDICSRVPANPPSTFYEALQAVWFINIGFLIEAWANGIGLGRPDQYLYPFYKRDLEAGILTREEATELIELIYIKYNGLLTPQDAIAAKVMPGFAIWANITLGGVDKDGNDAVNELTYVFLDAEESVRLMSEDLVIRIHKKNPDAYVKRAVEVLKVLRGKFKFVNDEVTMAQLVGDGKSPEFASDYIMSGCITPTVSGYSNDVPGALFNLPLMLELALNNGVWKYTGEQVGIKTGDPRNFKSYEDVWNAYKKQVEAFLPNTVMFSNADRKVFAEYAPAPFQSSFYPTCIERGIDITNGGVAPLASQATHAMGAPNVADALAAIKKAVFEDKKITMPQLITALEKNFESDSEGVLHILEGCPKFGNDDDYVDSIMKQIIDHFSGIIRKYKSLHGVLRVPGILALTTNIPLGSIVGALPDGRKAGMPFADGGISPCQGRNISGPTATFNSVAKLDHSRLSGGVVLNMRFNPDVVKNDTNRQKFSSLIRTFFDIGGSFVQFNIVDTEVLKAAQQTPEKYRDLLVRVSTYSAYFVELSKELQDDIIARMEIQEV